MREHLGEEHLANLYTEVGKFTEAEALYRERIGIIENSAEDAHQS